VLLFESLLIKGVFHNGKVARTQVMRVNAAGKQSTPLSAFVGPQKVYFELKTLGMKSI
jgi:hypothetical protein